MTQWMKEKQSDDNDRRYGYDEMQFDRKKPTAAKTKTKHKTNDDEWIESTKHSSPYIPTHH